MTIEELKAMLKKDHKIDIDEIVGKASKFDEAQGKAVQADAVRAALAKGGIQLSESDDLGSQVASLVDERVSLSERVNKAEERLETAERERKREKAEAKVRPYAAKGLVAEAQRESMISLAETNPDLADGVLKSLSGGVLLSEVASSYSEPPPSSSHDANGDVQLSEDEKSDIERLSKEAAQLTGRATT